MTIPPTRIRVFGAVRLVSVVIRVAGGEIPLVVHASNRAATGRYVVTGVAAMPRHAQAIFRPLVGHFEAGVSNHVVFVVVGDHVNSGLVRPLRAKLMHGFQPQPEIGSQIAESVLVVGPVSVERRDAVLT